MKKKLLIMLVTFVLPLLGVYAWWGGFNSVDVGVVDRPPLAFAYQEVTGDYTNVPDALSKTLRVFETQNLSAGASVVVLLDDPRVAPRKEQRAWVGFAVPADSVVHQPLFLESLPARRAVVARVKAAPLLAPGKAYASLIGYLKEQGRDYHPPSLEIYDQGSLAVEMLNSPEVVGRVSP